MRLNKRLIYLLTALLISSLGFVVISCVNSPSEESSPPDFPLTQGTTWVYTYIPYEPRPSDPTQIITAAYIITETVVETETSEPYLFARVQRDTKLTSAVPLTLTNLPTGEFWYVISGTQVFKENQATDPTTFDPVYSQLVYDFPLKEGKTWCPIQVDLKNPDHPEEVHCEANGLRTVAKRAPYQTPAGNFADCYQITEAYLSGGVIRWFCYVETRGIGVAAAHYDHAGTRYGFEKTLISYTSPSP
jgi:hypothetical protein